MKDHKLHSNYNAMIKTQNLTPEDKKLLKTPANESGKWQLICSSADDSVGVGNLMRFNMPEDVLEIGRVGGDLYVRVIEEIHPSNHDKSQSIKDPWKEEATYEIFDFVVIKN